LIGEAIDRLVGMFSPRRGLERAWSRQLIGQFQGRGYDGGKLNRITQGWFAKSEAGDTLQLGDTQRLRWRAWDLYQNNPHARKVVRALVAQTVGCGLQPDPQSLRPGGEPDEAARKRSQELWRAVGPQLCGTGRPGQGGVHWGQMVQQAMAGTVVFGEILGRFRYLTRAQAKRKRLVLPLVLDLIEAERLADQYTFAAGTAPTKGEVFRGIELDDDDQPIAYWIYPRHPADPLAFLKNNVYPERIDAGEVRHLYAQERPGQRRGVTWFAPALLQLRDVGDYQYNELMASAVAACVALAIERNPGGPLPGLTPPSGASSTDDDGNRITRLQPGMFFDKLAPGEKLNGFNPQRPNSSAEGFINHMLRGTAAAFPGLKASTLTMDYRGSSFSSERAAENDNWRETEQLQDWLVWNFCQPVYDEVIRIAVISGWFDGVITDEQYADNPQLLSQANWHGPIAKSINPKDDEEASELAMANGTSSLPIEASARGTNWRQNLDDAAAVLEYATQKGLPDWYIQRLFGMKPAPAGSAAPGAAGDETPRTLVDEYERERAAA
jgi:lambda family phage portal protein